jgi:hypothetical protein
MRGIFEPRFVNSLKGHSPSPLTDFVDGRPKIAEQRNRAVSSSVRAPIRAKTEDLTPRRHSGRHDSHAVVLKRAAWSLHLLFSVE